MQWLKRLLLRSPAGATSAWPLIQSVLMTIPEWHEDTSSRTMRTWHHPEGGVLSLGLADRAALPSLTDLHALRDTCRRLAQANSGGLVEVAVIETPFGSSALLIYKRLQGHAFIFTGMLLIPIATQKWFVWTTVHGEQGTTGVREAIVTGELLESGNLTLDSYELSWAQDPYEPGYRGVDRKLLRYTSDDHSYDSRFPEHPLSKVRMVLSQLPDNVHIEPGG